MKIRKATKKDITGCLKMQKSDNEGSYWEKDDLQNSIKDEHVIFLVAENKKEIIGYIIGFIVPSKRNEAMVHETRVLKKYRGQKIGTQLVNELNKKLFEKGAKIIYALIEHKLLPFYQNSCQYKQSAEWIQMEKKRK